MNTLPKFVASTTMKTASWNNSTVISDDLPDDVRAIKQRFDRDIVIYGSASVVHRLMPAGLIDEFRLMIYPVVLGRGKRLFPDAAPSTLTLVDSQQLGSGIVLLTYKTTDGTEKQASIAAP
jgi:dihydrofolate reductase